MTLDSAYLFLHLVGIILWLGVGFALSFFTGRAARAGDRRVAAFAYRTASRLHKTLGVVGMLLTVGSGVALTASRGYAFFQPFPDHWLFQMQVLGIATFLLALLYQVPLSDKLARAAEASAEAGEDSAAYQKYRRRNAVVSSIVGLLLIVVVALGTFRP